MRRHHRMTAGLAGAAAILLLTWAGWIWLARDPVSLLTASAVEEHAEYVRETMARPAADSSAVVRELRTQVDFAFEPVYPGDAQLQLLAGMVTELRGTRAATLVYRDAAGRYTTLFLMPEAGVVVPSEHRIPIETFKPYHRVTDGRHLLLWKQRGLAWLLVSDLDEAGTAAIFLKIRKAS